MKAKKLPHYIMMHRKQCGLSKQDLTFLLGRKSTSTLTKLEKTLTLPDIEIALKLGFILDAPLPEIFSGSYEEYAQETKAQAQLYLPHVEALLGNKHMTHKDHVRLKTIRNILA